MDVYGDLLRYRELFTSLFRRDLRAKYKGKRCRIRGKGKMNSCLLEFEDGHQMVTSRNAIRKAK